MASAHFTDDLGLLVKSIDVFSLVKTLFMDINKLFQF
jgi:hypothetical protein